MSLRYITSAKFIRNCSNLRDTLNMDPESMIGLIKTCIPPLDGTHHKGQAGRIGVVGGSLEYTGAPYFAGISALKVGADLVHIFCTTPAATVIKCYSPELIVHPLLDKENAIKEISPWLERLHVIVIGPGLGREAQTFDVVVDLIKLIKIKKIPLIIDADGLFLITEKLELIQTFSSPVILTPNKIEYERLKSKLELPDFNLTSKNISILRKGETDELFCSDHCLEWKYNKGGTGRRCGGQGDLLSGSIATFLHWAINYSGKLNSDILKYDKNLLASSLSCFAASALIRTCNSKAFQKQGRSMLAMDMINQIHEAFQDLYGE